LVWRRPPRQTKKWSLCVLCASVVKKGSESDTRTEGRLAMYEQYYGLKENPFKVTPDPRFVYMGEKHREALAQLLYGVKESKGFIVITGEVGTGKTTMIHYLLGRFNGNGHTKTAFLFNPKLTVDDFLEYILDDLGIKAQQGGKATQLQALHKFLLECYEKDVKVVLIVDEAQGLKPEVLEEIRLLSNFETAKSKLLQIVLVGQPELNHTLAESAYRQLRQRINLRYHLTPLSRKEMVEYIEKRLRTAGGNRSLFSEKAIREVYRRSRGVPRLINILCDNSLLNAYALDQKQVDEKSVKEAARDLKLIRMTLSTWIWIVLCLAACATVLVLFRVQVLGLMEFLSKGLVKHFHNLRVLFSGFHEIVEYLRETVFS
jgi:general secretion pathway protein A